MARTSTQIEIPVNLKASLEGLKEVQTQVSSALDKAGKNTTLGKTLAKELSTTAAKFSEIDEILLSPTIDESGLKRLERLADQISSHFAQSFAKIDFSSFEQLATEDQLKHMRELQELTRKQRRELEAINKQGSQERTDTYLVRTGNEVALNHMRNQKGFDATLTLSKNQQAMERLSQSHERTVVGMKKQLEEYEQKADEAFNAWDAADKRVKVLEPQVATLRKDSYAATFYDKIGRMNTRISANPETVNPRISSIEKELGSALRSVEAGGVIATEARDALKDWITHTFTNINSAEAGQMVGMTVNKLLEKLMEKIFGQGYEADREGGYDLSHSTLLARGQDFANVLVKLLNAKHSTGSASDLALVSQQKIKELREAQAEATTQENAAERYMDLGMALETQIVETQQAANHTRFLAQELGRYAEAAKRAAQASKQGEINDSEQAQRDYTTQAKQEQRDTYDPLKQAHGNAKSDVDAGLKEAGDSWVIANTAEVEAEDFKKHLKQSIAHWASAQQIINVVKDGIRQAYQDIKALDNAMTNIAVVTDMSIGDLWGKINEYMSIAKQYGVTTQGVYEVSQLYYQQGLSTNEVMAATTETLKMARIAGMDYAEAADAMTVAIRAFKMEMADAEHVTDVYSKVAAVTASDSEELAIAMSKTASSAESVGSSFENTTAMLAVMIETTRESAQNLGSALKSIISRYGEMKVGLTVDSEGEEIDYNKVDTALKSVGISIKDAQGQFRDFDDVIFELSEKWSGLDKNTQRYIATIMAGNRQQSRFIALVDNWERLEEVSAAAADSADAGLLQYAKTLDSLDTKLNTLKTNFQQFYMSIFNGEFFKGIIDIANNVVTSLSRMGPILGSINLIKLINQIKLIGQLLLNSFSGAISQVRNANKKWQDNFTNGWESVGERIARKIAEALIKAAPKTGKAYVEGIQAGINRSQQVKTSSQEQTNLVEAIANNEATLTGLHSLTGLSVVQESIANSTKGYHSKANYAFGRSGANKNNSYLAYANQILNNPNASQIDKDWANKIKVAYSQYVQVIDAAGVTVKQQQQAGQKALQAIKQADAERNEEVQILSQRNEELKQQQAQIEAETQAANKTARLNKIKQSAGQAAFTVGTLAQTAALGMDTSTMGMYDAQGWVKGLGGAATVAGQFLTGNYLGGVITAVTTVVDLWNHVTNRAKVELENAKKAAEEANIERAESKEEYKSLESYTKRLEELNETRFESNEAQEEWLALNNEMAEKYPELISYIDSEGNSIVNLTAGYEKLSQAKAQALKDNADYWAKELDYQQKQMDQIGNTTFNSTVLDSNAATINTDNLATDMANGVTTQYNGASGTLFWNGTEFMFWPLGGGDAWSISPDDVEWAASEFGNGVLSYKTPEDIPNFYKNFFVNSEEYTDSDAYKKILEIFQVQSEGNTIYSLVDSGIDMAGMVGVLNSEEGSALADPFIRTGLVERDPTDGRIKLTETGNYVAQLQKDRNLYERTVENFISSTGNLILQTSTVLESISDISGWEELALISSTSNASSYGKDWRQMNEIDIRTAYEEFANTTKAWYSTLSQKKQDEFNNVLTNLNNYTEEELKRILTEDFGLKDTDPIYKAIELKYAEQRRTAVERYAANFGQGEFQSFEAYKADKASADKTDEELAQDYIADITSNNTDIANLTTKELETYVNRRLELDALIKDDQNALWSTFNDQKQLVETAKSYLNNSTLDEDARTELEALISAEDFGSHDWAKRVNEWEQKWDKKLTETGNIISESYFLYVETILDEVDNTVEKFKDLAEKQSKGFTFDEAIDLLNDYRKLMEDPSLGFDEVFEVLADGTIILKDFAAVSNKFYQDQINKYRTEAERAKQSIESIYTTFGENAGYSIEVFKQDSDVNWLNKVLADAGVDPTMIQTITAGIADGTIKTWNDVIEVLGATEANLEAAEEYFSKQMHRSNFTAWKDRIYKGTANVSNWIEGKGTFDDLGELWAADYVEKSGDEGFQNVEEFDEFINNQIAGIRGAYIDKTGNLIITDQEEFLNYVQQYDSSITNETIRQYTAEVQDTVFKTIETIFDFIKKAIEGTLSATDLQSMGQTIVDQGIMSADEWQNFASKNISRVGTGYKMNRAAAFALQVNTGNYDFEGLVDQFDSIEEVNEMLEELSENSEEWGDEFVRAAERVLESIKMIKAQDPGDAIFNWMDQDMEGWAGTYESTMGSIGKAGEVINASMESGTMGLNDFYNMSQIVGQHLTGDALREWEQYRDAVYATATTVDGGTVSLTAGGKSMEYALNAMSESTEAYYQKIAKQQIDFIDKQIAALEAQKKVEEALTGKDINKDGTISAGLTRDELILNEDDYLDYGLATQRLKEDGIGLYNEADYLDAEKEWLSKRPQYIAGEDQSEYNTPEAFANTVSMYLEEATRDALKAGLDITDAQVQQQIKDSAMARAGVSGYYDTLSNEELQTLTKIEANTAQTAANTSKNGEPTNEDKVAYFNELVYQSRNEYGTGYLSTGKLNEEQAEYVINAMNAEYGNTWHEAIASSGEFIGGSGFSSAELYKSMFPVELPTVPSTGTEVTDDKNSDEQGTTSTDTDLTHLEGTVDGMATDVDEINSKMGQSDSIIAPSEPNTGFTGTEDFDNGNWAYSTDEDRANLVKTRHTLEITEQSLKDITIELDNKIAELEEAQVTITNLETELAAANEQVTTLEQQLLEEKDSHQQTRDELATANEQVTALQQQLLDEKDSHQQTRDELDAEREARGKEAEATEAMLRAKDAEIQTYKTLLDSSGEHYSLLLAERDALQTSKDALEKDLEAALKRVAFLESSIDFWVAHSAQLNTEISQLKDEKRELSKDYNQLAGEVIYLRKQVGNTTTFTEPAPGSYEEYTYDEIASYYGTLIEDAKFEEDGITLTPEAADKISKAMAEEFAGIDWKAILTNPQGAAYIHKPTQEYYANTVKASFEVDEEVVIDNFTNAAANAAIAFQEQINTQPADISVTASTGLAQDKVDTFLEGLKTQKGYAAVTVDFVTTDGTKIDIDKLTALTDRYAAVGKASATGNVSGLAFATGTEKLIAGANLANKALVGELGPELAVYNGQYHLLGANGAEFANIPSNAIIFNHKQTEGILKGQANIRGRVKDGGEAFAEGNVSGPAYAPGNIDAAIAALQEARAMWESLLTTPLDKILGRNKASGGGSGISAVDIGELEEWYNLLRQIEAIQDDINLLIAERNNLEAERNGEATLRNLRQQQSLLEKQRATQEQLMKYQRIQLERQKNEILRDPVWNKFLTFDESTGAIQYTKGNELFGGKGAWEFLQDLDQMSAKKQIAAVNKLGYTAKDKEGKQLTGEELVKHFVDAAKNIEEEYRNLDNTVRESETELENIDSSINEIEQTIRDNEMALQQEVFDTIVDAWEANIEALEEQKDLIEEANDAYTEGLREALDAERKAYEDEASVADREQLQRELSLLRRSGGSASEIADLEEQIDNALKDEYFKSQEDMIADIEEANKNQIELLEKQIKIEEETLEYQKENGIIWQQVATILSGTKESIMAFFSGSAPGFFAQSKNQQIDALNKWSYMIGLYKEDQLIKNTSTQALNDMNNSNGQMWGHTGMSGYYKKFSSSEMTDKERKSAADAYATEYAKLLSEGKTEEQAAEGARKVLRDRIDQYSTPAPKGKNIKPPVTDGDEVKYKTVTITTKVMSGKGSPKTVSKAKPKTTYTLAPNPASGYAFSQMQVGNTSPKTSTSFSVSGRYASVEIKVWYTKTKGVDTGAREGDASGITTPQHGVKIATQDGTVVYDTGTILHSKTGSTMNSKIESLKKQFAAKYPISECYKYYAYKTGGLVDYTGLAMVHGSASKPEAFLNAEQTAQIKDALMLQTREGLLSSLQDSLLKFQSTIDGTVSGITSEANNSSINIQPGAVVIQVEELANNYDVEKLSNDVMNRMTAIAAKATNRGVNRR